MTTTRDQNGKRLAAKVAREADGTWGANVWFGGANGLGTDVRRYYYETRDDARCADISHEIGKFSRVR